jgi:hypothetical protein
MTKKTTPRSTLGPQVWHRRLTENSNSSKRSPRGKNILPTNLLMIEEEVGVFVRDDITNESPADVEPDEEGQSDNVSRDWLRVC